MHYLLAILLALSLTACASQSTIPPPPPDPVINTDGTVTVPVDQGPLQSKIDALTKLAEHPLLSAANRDAADTLAWVNGPTGPTDPLMKFRASQCPLSIQLATANLKQQIGVLQGLLRQKDAELQGLGDGKLEIVKALTMKRYGPVGAPGSDIKGMIAMIEHDVAERTTAVVDSCRAIVPIKQIHEVVQLANRAGLAVATSGGSTLLGGLLP